MLFWWAESCLYRDMQGISIMTFLPVSTQRIACLQACLQAYSGSSGKIKPQQVNRKEKCEQSQTAQRSVNISCCAAFESLYSFVVFKLRVWYSDHVCVNIPTQWLKAQAQLYFILCLSFTNVSLCAIKFPRFIWVGYDLILYSYERKRV